MWVKKQTNLFSASKCPDLLYGKSHTFEIHLLLIYWIIENRLGSEREHLSVYPVEVLCLVVLMFGMSLADKQGFPRAVVGFKSVVVGRFFSSPSDTRFYLICLPCLCYFPKCRRVSGDKTWTFYITDTLEETVYIKKPVFFTHHHWHRHTSEAIKIS